MSNEAPKVTKPEMKMVDITTIVPYWRNPRNNEKAVAAVKASMERYGVTQPIIVDTKLVIIAGHTRYMAAKQLGLTKLPCIISDMSEALASEYRVVDNKTNEAATWDMDKLMAEMREWTEPAAVQATMPTFDIEAFLKATVTPPPLPTNEQIQKQGEQMQQDVAGIASATRNLVDMVCPHCAETFQVDRDEVARRSFYVPVTKPTEAKP